MDILSIRDTTIRGLVCFFEDTPQEHDKKTINSFNFLEMGDNDEHYNNFPRQDTLLKKETFPKILAQDFFKILARFVS